MSVYARFKRGPEGLRAIVSLLESTPLSRRQKMIEVGTAEDPEFTAKVLALLLTFEDVIQLPDLELAELMATAPPRMTGYAISKLEEEVQRRFLRCSKPAVASQVREAMDVEVELREIGGAQLKLIEVTRSLEKKGLVNTKKIPG